MADTPVKDTPPNEGSSDSGDSSFEGSSDSDNSPSDVEAGSSAPAGTPTVQNWEARTMRLAARHARRRARDIAARRRLHENSSTVVLWPERSERYRRLARRANRRLAGGVTTRSADSGRRSVTRSHRRRPERPEGIPPPPFPFTPREPADILRARLVEQIPGDINLILNPSLPDFNRRVRNGARMIMHLEYLLEVAIPRFEQEVVGALDPEESPFEQDWATIPGARLGGEWLNRLGSRYHLGDSGGRRGLFHIFRTLTVSSENDRATSPHRVRNARDVLAHLRFLWRSFGLVEDLMRHTLLPENTPWTMSFQAHELPRLRDFLYSYGRLIRVGEQDDRVREIHRDHLNDFGFMVIPSGWLPTILQEEWDQLQEHLLEDDPRMIAQYIPGGFLGGYVIEPALPSPPQPATQAAVDALPVKSYDDLKDNDKVCGEVCAICGSQLEGDLPITELPCGHFFHEECVNAWLLGSRNTCPVCRAPIPEPPESPVVTLRPGSPGT